MVFAPRLGPKESPLEIGSALEVLLPRDGMQVSRKGCSFLLVQYVYIVLC